MKAPVNGIFGEVQQRVVHPSQVPFHAEAQTSDVYRLAYARPRRRFLGDHQDTRMLCVHDGVEFLDELDRLEVLASSEDVGHPLPLFAAVIEIEHGCNRINAEAVDVEFLDPVESIRDEKIAYLVASVVEDQRPPVGVMTSSWIDVLVQSGSVESCESPLVSGEMSRHPIGDDAYPFAVKRVDEVTEVVRRTKPCRRCEVITDLVAPRAREWMLCDWHELDVRKSHLSAVVRELVCHVAIPQRCSFGGPTPRPEVHLVDRQWVAEALGRFPLCQPFLVVPGVVRFEHDARGGGRDLRGRGIRIGLQVAAALDVDDLVLVLRYGPGSGNEELPDAGRPHHPHRMKPSVPTVEVALDAQSPGGWRPHCERHAPYPALGDGTRAEPFPQAQVTSFTDEVQIEVADGRQERVRIAHRIGIAVRIYSFEFVIAGERINGRLEEPAGIDLLELGYDLALVNAVNALCIGAVRAQDGALIGRVRTEHAVRIGDFSAHQELELREFRFGHDLSEVIRSMPRRGIHAH